MIQYKKIKRRYIYIFITAVWLILCIIGYINANHRFPQPVKEYYSIGDEVEYRGLQIKAEELSFENTENITNKYPAIKKVNNNSKYNFIVLKLLVKNISDNMVNFELDIVPNVAMSAYPIGYSNQGYALAVNEDDDILFKAGEEKEVILYFVVGNGLVRQSRRKKFLESDFYFDMSVYPVHKAIVFDSIINETE